MRILYQVSFAHAMGADRWIYEGYRHAFRDKGYELHIVSERDHFESVVREMKPDILMLEFNGFEKYCNSVRCVEPGFFEEVRKWNTKVFVLVGFERYELPQRIDFVRRYAGYFDVFYTNYTCDVSQAYETIIGKPCCSIYHAADHKYFFPDEADDRLKCDIAFVGSTYGAKMGAFKTLLYPLMRKYHVRVYGPGWLYRDKALRLASGFSRKYRVDWLADMVNKRRMTISQSDERKLYGSAKICINIHEYYGDGTCKGFSNEREMKIPASGGFQLSDYVPGMERYFEPDEEIVIARTPKEWFEKIEYYLSHEDERKRIQEKGTARALRDHTYHNRVEQVMELYRGLNTPLTTGVGAKQTERESSRS